MSNTRELYNNEYKKFTPYFFENKPIAAVDNYLDENSESLKNFLKQYFAQFNLESRLKTSSCLELGSGLGGLSLYLAKTFQHFLGLDISELAVLSA
ncbi:MAG: hypothetical protein HON90_18085, partial [Halobacteriovoraceae bacterium]|nr:hypothetical protein [Halobacteriovoraceae bacterium]